jgi:Uma2 family endonuclease
LVVKFVFLWLLKVFGERFVDIEAPIDVRPDDNLTNEPVPDLIVLKRDGATIADNPQPQDLQLVVEVSDGTLNFDLNVKAALYARAGIGEYWVVDVAGRRLICHRNPESGRYTSVAIYGEHEPLAPLSAPDWEFLPRRFYPPKHFRATSNAGKPMTPASQPRFDSSLQCLR